MPKGLLNLGNTCYMNAGLQMLLANKDFCKLINKYSQNNEKIKIINNFIQEYFNGENQQIAPKAVKQLVGESDAMFAGFIQNDASEFVIKLLDIVENIIKEINTNDMFSIKFKSIIKCKKRDCLEKSETFYSNNYLLLEMYPDVSTLEKLYKKFKTSEILSGDEKFLCSKCKVKRVASKKTKVDTWPKHLVIWLKRFTSNGRSFNKNSQRIEIPLKWRHGYELIGGVIHDGGLGGGHYYWVGKYNNKWIVCNDGSVSEIDEQRALQIISSAYWVYYEKKKIEFEYSSYNTYSP
jgi:ubiquitin C-terminal hydrolase